MSIPEIAPAELLTTGMSPGVDSGPEKARQFYSAIEREVRTVPGVGDVAWGSALPFDGQFFGQAFEVDGDPPRPPSNRDGAVYQIVGPSYFRLLGIPVLAGRTFTDADATNAPQVAIVDEAFVAAISRDAHRSAHASG